MTTVAKKKNDAPAGAPPDREPAAPEGPASARKSREIPARAPKPPAPTSPKPKLIPAVIAEVSEKQPAQLPTEVTRRCQCGAVFETRDPARMRCEASRRALAAVGVGP